VKVGTLIEIDYRHLPVARRMAPDRRVRRAKITDVFAVDSEPGWLYVQAFAARTGEIILVAIPPERAQLGTGYNDGRGPKVRVVSK
jgi:hypothetical protein